MTPKQLKRQNNTNKMRANVILSFLLLLLVSCNSNYGLRIVVNKETVFPGDTFIARIYVNHNDSIAPEYFIIKSSDTIQFTPDPSDNYCGIYRAGFHKIGKKSINGFVKFYDTNDKWQIKDFKIKFEVIKNPDSSSTPGQK
jgi:hypothetical protein